MLKTVITCDKCGAQIHSVVQELEVEVNGRLVTLEISGRWKHSARGCVLCHRCLIETLEDRIRELTFL